MAKTAAPKMSLGDFAKATPAKAAKSDKEVVMAPVDVAKQIDAYQEAKEKVDIYTGQMKRAEGIIKEYGRKTAVETILAKGKDFSSFVLSSAKTGLLYIVQDRFKQVNSENIDMVRSIVGDEHVVETTKYVLNPDVLAKHQDKIVEAIQKLAIPQEDKSALLLAQTAYGYDFGLNDIGRIAAERKVSVDAVFGAVSPVQQLKTRSEK